MRQQDDMMPMGVPIGESMTAHVVQNRTPFPAAPLPLPPGEGAARQPSLTAGSSTVRAGKAKPIGWTAVASCFRRAAICS